MDELKPKLADLKVQLTGIVKKLDPDEQKKTLRQLEAKTLKKGFWHDEQQARGITQQISDIKSQLELIDSLSQKIQDMQGLIDLIKSESDTASLKKDLSKEFKQLEKSLDKLETETFLSGEYDNTDAIVSIHSGQGGTEAMDWAAMLLRMYLKFIERRGWKVDLTQETPGEEAGIKSATLLVQGKFAYGYLKGEAGTHRLVRQSPFNADNLRQTSFALVEVMPTIEESKQVAIRPEEIEFSAFRSSGKGGQNVNKVSTAVRLKHLPTGIVVESQTQRTQEQNRKIATKLLTAKLWQVQQLKRQKKIADVKGDHKIAGWGNQIRSYVLHPYKMVKDLRTNVETNQPDKVLDGHLDEFIEEEIKQL